MEDRLIEWAVNKGFGCWYCGRKDIENLRFSLEFDTPVHLSCIEKALKQDPNDEEAIVFWREFNA
ncbi:hypothetical protein GCM10010965_14600 [Caldalkalibacillus thermarum]|uniref:hypothetical protein n=1 Tax=Caldalkalibacillus thermarum TaxID=296745 RepID=UPI00166ED475|nr:hypothetical protein [Caldalkalibacillus thermarum]GGK22789.1 hypothetical protein GCM10010965_14600 [Caldalkalibacillus thermarum]